MEGNVPHLLFYGAALTVAAIGYRAFKRAAKRAHERVADEDRERRTGATGTLHRDPESGRYRIRRDY